MKTNNKKTFLTTLILFFLTFSYAFSQSPRDQDLITLNNGTQILGYVVEQHPGKLIKIYRPNLNDTVIAKMEDIDKLSKVCLNIYSDKKIHKKDTTFKIGRFNNKKNIYQLSLMTSTNLINLKYDGVGQVIYGPGFSYYRSFNNNIFLGMSTYYFLKEGNAGSVAINGERATTTSDISKAQFLLEGRIRLSSHPQTKRLTTLFGLSAGYIHEESGERITYTGSYYKDATIISPDQKITRINVSGGFAFQSSLTFKLNPDNNSGFIIEPGYSFYNPTIENYNINGKTLSREKANWHSFSIRFSYFF